MEKIKKRKIIIPVTLSVIVFLTMGFFILTKKESARNSEEIVSNGNAKERGIADIQDESVGGSDGIFENKKVRLEKFYLWSKREPLLYSLTMDREKVLKAIDRLEAEEKIFVKNQQLPRDLFPFDFLKKFIETSVAFVEFEKNVSDDKAEALLGKMKETRDAYLEELESLKETIVGLEEVFGTSRVAFLGGDTYTEVGLILRDFQKMKENASEISKEIEIREKCLKNNSNFCETDFAENAISLESQIENRKNQEEPEFFSKKMINFPETSKSTGPFRIKSDCWRGDAENYLYVLKVCPDYLDYCMENSYLANKAYFASVPGSGTFGEKLREQGIQAIPQRATNPYACANMEYQTDLAVLNHFFERYADKPLFEEIMKSEDFSAFSLDDQDAMKKGDEFERGFFSKKYPSDSDLEELVAHYEHAYFVGIGNGLFSDELGEKLLERLLIQKEKLVDFDLLLNTALHFLEGLRMQLEPGNGLSSKDYIYSARSDYSLLYLNFSDAVWRLREKPEYFKIGERRKEPVGIYNFEEAVLKFGEDKLNEWVDSYQGFEERYVVYKRELEKKR